MRIVSLLPSATEVLFAIGAGDDVVGVTHECDFPAAALGLPKLTRASGPELTSCAEIDRHVRTAMHQGSSLYELDAARLDELAPDLIVTQELCPVCAVSYEIVATAAKRLRSCHPERSRRARVVSLEPNSLADVLETIRFLGGITGYVENAARVVTGLQARIDALRAASPSPLVLRLRSGLRARGDTGCAGAQGDTLILEWTDPPMSAGHWIPELIELAGGTPVLANPRANSRRLEWPAIAQADPDAIVVAPCGFDLARTRHAIAELAERDEWKKLRAVREGRVLALDGNAYLSRPGPRLVDAAEIISRWYTSLAEHAG
ncbi:MAG TPA: cobalamin-binding protein [Candidatus Nitrosotalea sp.]|nr:cobalamin-binding protein [Candidatus Nitrosotalea sp.]